MKKRIKEIAVAAGATINEGFYEDVVGLTMSPKELEHFATFIVLDVLAKKDQHWCDGDIKQHYGV